MKPRYKFIRHDLIMLKDVSIPRNDAPLFRDSMEGQLVFNSYGENTEFKDCSYFHLFLTNDEPIISGDWFIGRYEDSDEIIVAQAMEVDFEEDHIQTKYHGSFDSDHAKKVCVSTCKHLLCPPFSKKFLVTFAEDYNGDISDVLVEYKRVGNGDDYEIHVREDFTIVTRPTKVYSRRDFMDLFEVLETQGCLNQRGKAVVRDWKEENFK